MEGWLLDVHPLPRRGKMAVWLWRSEGHVVRLLDDFDNHIYVEDLQGDYGELEAICQKAGARYELEKTKLELGSQKETRALKIHLGLGQETRFARALNQRGGFGRYRFYGLDPELEQRYLAARKLFPLGRVTYSRGKLKALGSRWELVPPPPLVVARLEVKVAKSRAGVHVLDPLAGLELERRPLKWRRAKRGSYEGGGKARLKPWTWQIRPGSTDGRGVPSEVEKEGLAELQKVLEEWQVDVLVSRGGNEWVINYLWARADLAGLDYFRLGRQRQPPRPRRPASSYVSYGQVHYKRAAYHLRGRLHLDREDSFFWGEGALEGLIHLSRMSGVPLQTMAQSTPGSAISTMQIGEALRRGYPVLWKKNLPEVPKTMAQLACADRGGYICDPQVGVHEGVAEVDFISLYPHIMVNYNISPEAFACDCCPDTGRAIPGLPYHFCARQEGLVPASLRPLLKTRRACKALTKSPDDHYKRIADSIKWLLVCCFGYQGYRNARYGRIEGHEAIQAVARRTMMRAIELTREAGYEVLHGIVDSLWVKGPWEGLPALAGRITRETGLPLALEALYRWVVFLPNRSTGTGALNRYYGLKVDGTVKYRGVEVRQHDTPPYLAQAQEAMVEALARAEGVKQFYARIPEAVAALRAYAGPLLRGEVAPSATLHTRRVSRQLEAYRSYTDNVAALEQLLEEGVRLRPGQQVRYLVANKRGKLHAERVTVAELLRGDETYDTAYYYKELLRVGESLLLPFGYTVERLDRAVRIAV